MSVLSEEKNSVVTFLEKANEGKYVGGTLDHVLALDLWNIIIKEGSITKTADYLDISRDRMRRCIGRIFPDLPSTKAMLRTKLLEKIDKKWCPECETVLDPERFYRNKQTRDGLNAVCKRCCQVNREFSYYI